MRRETEGRSLIFLASFLSSARAGQVCSAAYFSIPVRTSGQWESVVLAALLRLVLSVSHSPYQLPVTRWAAEIRLIRPEMATTLQRVSMLARRTFGGRASFFTYSQEPAQPLPGRQVEWMSADEAVKLIKSGSSFSHTQLVFAFSIEASLPRAIGPPSQIYAFR